MKVILIAASLLAVGAIAAPAEANHACVKGHVCVHWDCLQVYPWSRLCEGDVVGFLDAILGEWLLPDLCLVASDLPCAP